MNVTLQKIHDALEAVSAGAAKDVTESTQIADLSIDSLDTFQFFSEIEDKTGKEIGDEVYDSIETIQHVLDYFNAD